MKTTHHTSEKILQGIKNKNDDVISYLYTVYFGSIQRFITNNKGSREDAEDIFQDAIVILYRKLRNNELTLTCSLKTYMYAVCRNLWLKRLRRLKINNEQFVIEDNHNYKPLEMETDLEQEAKFLLYQKHLLNLSNDCRQILSLFINNKSLTEIRDIMGFKSVDYTKTRKYLCKERLKERILNDPDYQMLLI